LSDFYEIAYAASAEQLCLFTGTGFSKAVSGNEAPSWQGLLEDVCDCLKNSSDLKLALFPGGRQGVLSLEEAAQVIAIELSNSERSIHREIALRIQKLQPKGDNSELKKFLSERSFKVITTNYDKLVEQLSGSFDCLSLAPGFPIPRSKSRVKIFHVHGSVDSPENMIVTSNDYFRFMSGESYFSRKLSTILHENTVVILGYSLGDTNLKTIINDYKSFSRSHMIGSNIFLVSRQTIDRHIKDYYSHCYGIRVLDNLEICDFFKSLNAELPKTDERLAHSINNIRSVIFDGKKFNQVYLRIENSFFEIVASLGAIGLSINDPKVVRMLDNIIQDKIKLTNENGAWAQYEHLAKWLAHLASILELKDTSIEATYLDAALRSMNGMASGYRIGYSWHAYNSWLTKWPGIMAPNRALIKEYIQANTTWPDAIRIISAV
jgi:SIR2-like domain